MVTAAAAAAGTPFARRFSVAFGIRDIDAAVV